MNTIAIFLLYVVVITIGAFLLLFVLYAFNEKEGKAARRGILVLTIFILMFWFFSFLPEPLFPLFMVLLVVLSAIVLPKYRNPKIQFSAPVRRFDERDVMFSRNTLKEGTPKFEAYYKRRPQHKAADDAFRAAPGLMSKGALQYNEMLFNAAHASFETVDLLQKLVENDALVSKSELNPDQIASFLKKWTLKLGAVDVGFTVLNPQHVYTHVGRGEAYGKEVDLEHNYALAFTVEMNAESLSYNPKGPVVMESAQQYLNAGQIAIQVAQFLRRMGYQARAHIDANYRLICPVVAMDAGLGVIGRMGLLMTPKQGPRVRIGVVSTNLPLPQSKKNYDSSALHFCNRCKKCAINCPSQAVPSHSLPRYNNAERWVVNHEKCFTYWCKVGTDCGRCVAVCPYSHANNIVHNLSRWLIKRNPFNRWVALILDDFFYGSKPRSKALKDWMGN